MCHAFPHFVNIHQKAPGYTSALKIRIYYDIYLLEKNYNPVFIGDKKNSQIRKMAAGL